MQILTITCFVIQVISAVKEEGYRLTTVLTTHHHWDHAGGNEELTESVPGLNVYGGDERIGALNKPVKHDDTFKVFFKSLVCLTYVPSAQSRKRRKNIDTDGIAFIFNFHIALTEP